MRARLSRRALELLAEADAFRSLGLDRREALWGAKALTPEVFRTAMFYGSVMGSYAVEAFGTERLQRATRAEVDERFALLKEISHL